MMKISCDTRGEEILGVTSYIKDHYGEDALKTVERRLVELGYPFDFGKITISNWYPEAMNVLLIMILREAYNLTDEDIKEMGRVIPRVFILTRMLIKYFISLKKTFESGTEYWSKFVTCGTLEPYKMSEKEKYVIWRLKGYDFPAIQCNYLSGYLLGLAENYFGNGKVTVEETACLHRGDPFHEFTIKW